MNFLKHNVRQPGFIGDKLEFKLLNKTHVLDAGAGDEPAFQFYTFTSFSYVFAIERRMSAK